MKKTILILMAAASLTIAGHGQIPMRPLYDAILQATRDSKGNEVPVQPWRGYHDAYAGPLYASDQDDVYDQYGTYLGHISGYSSDGRCGFVTSPNGKVLKFSAETETP